MAEMKLTASKRDVLGKKVSHLRKQGMTPAHLFGHELESQSLQCKTVELMNILTHAGTTRLVSLKVEGDKEARSVFVRERNSSVRLCVTASCGKSSATS